MPGYDCDVSNREKLIEAGAKRQVVPLPATSAEAQEMAESACSV
jgi:hypothetical protein